jgi:hypothetical protein
LCLPDGREGGRIYRPWPYDLQGMMSPIMYAVLTMHSLCTQYALTVHPLLQGITPSLCTMHSLYTHYTPTTTRYYTLTMHYVLTMHPLCTHYYKVLHPHYALCTHYTLTIHPLLRYPLLIYDLQGMMSPIMYAVLTMHPLCTHYALTMHPLCLTVHPLLQAYPRFGSWRFRIQGMEHSVHATRPLLVLTVHALCSTSRIFPCSNRLSGWRGAVTPRRSSRCS